MARILVVDDEATITTQLEERLTQMGYQVVGTASSGAEAIALARESRPDIIIMDIVMPGGVDGIEAAGRIKQELDIPVVFLTAYGDEDYIERAKGAEPLGFLTKPYQINTLRATLEVALHNQALTSGIKRSEHGWRRLLEEISEAIILCNPDGKIYFWNAGAEKIFGHTAPAAKEKTFLSLLSEGTSRETRETVSSAGGQTGGNMGETWREGIGIRSDWSRFPLEFCISPIQIGDMSSLIIIARDLSGRRHRENRLHASLKEREADLSRIRTQVENHLRLIYDLLSLQSDFLARENPEEKDFAGPANAERLTDMLGRLSPSSAGASIDFPLYVKNLTGRLMRAFQVDPERIDLAFHMDDVRLDLPSAIPWGIILSELLSNALTHAYPAGRSGRVRIEFRALDEAGFRLSVEDDGIGLPAEFDIRSPGMRGLRIVEKLTEQYQGRLQMDCRNGTCFRVLLPVS